MPMLGGEGVPDGSYHVSSVLQCKKNEYIYIFQSRSRPKTKQTDDRLF
jgi:hypothetical protein